MEIPSASPTPDITPEEFRKRFEEPVHAALLDFYANARRLSPADRDAALDRLAMAIDDPCYATCVDKVDPDGNPDDFRRCLESCSENQANLS